MRASDETFYGNANLTLTGGEAPANPFAAAAAAAAPSAEPAPLPAPKKAAEAEDIPLRERRASDEVASFSASREVPVTGSRSRPVSPHPAGLPPPPSGRLDIPPGAYVYTGPPLPPNALGRSEWLPDDAAPNCMRCGTEFNMLTRRHHCRQCGEIFCKRCCCQRALLQLDSSTDQKERVKAHWFWGKQETEPLKPQRVCSKCFDLLLPMQPYLTATLSKAVQAPDFSPPTVAEWAGKPISRSFKLEIKKAVHNLDGFLGMPDAGVVRRLLDRAHGVALLTIVKAGFLGCPGRRRAGPFQGPDLWPVVRSVRSGLHGRPVGAQLGGELSTVMLILNTADALQPYRRRQLHARCQCERSRGATGTHTRRRRCDRCAHSRRGLRLLDLAWRLRRHRARWYLRLHARPAQSYLLRPPGIGQAAAFRAHCASTGCGGVVPLLRSHSTGEHVQ